MNQPTPTAEEMKDAYKCAQLRRVGVSYQKAIMTDSIRIALRLTAIAMRNKTTVNTSPKEN
ncbi:MAG: hypothetical protein Q7U37_03170 [Gallionella sp.]|nr:hypothetical protein [Gallionella sp.]